MHISIRCHFRQFWMWVLDVNQKYASCQDLMVKALSCNEVAIAYVNVIM